MHQVNQTLSSSHLSFFQFHLFDVGGQRSQRRKWLHCFDNVEAVFFLAAISAYDQVLEEDSLTNRIKESIQLFGNIATNRWFENTSLVLFLNKTDLFAKKIVTTPLSDTFPEYEGKPGDLYQAQNFLVKQKCTCR